MKKALTAAPLAAFTISSVSAQAMARRPVGGVPVTRFHGNLLKVEKCLAPKICSQQEAKAALIAASQLESSARGLLKLSLGTATVGNAQNADLFQTGSLVQFGNPKTAKKYNIPKKIWDHIFEVIKEGKAIYLKKINEEATVIRNVSPNDLIIFIKKG